MSKLIIKNRYSVIPNDLLNNPEVSLRAKGLFAFIQSKPDGWDFSADRISNQTKEGLQAVISAIKELEKSGYLLRERIQNELGHWGVNYILREIPTNENPTIGNPTIGIPGIGKPANNIKKESSKKEEEKKKEIFRLTYSSNPLRNDLFEKWIKYKKEKKSTYTPSGINQLLKDWEDVPTEDLAKAINLSISNNWQGLFPPKKNTAPGSTDIRNTTTLQNKPIIPEEWQ